MEAAHDDGVSLDLADMNTDDWKKVRSVTAKELVKARNRSCGHREDGAALLA
jgi:hypothetical protein